MAVQVQLTAGINAILRGVVAPTLVQQNTSTVSAQNTPNRTITLPSVGASHSLVLTVSLFNGNATAVGLSGVTDSSSNTWTKAVTLSGLSGVVEIWLCKNPAATAGTLTITTAMTANTTDNIGHAYNVSEWSKVLTTRNTNTADGTATTQSITVTSVASDLVIACQSRFDNTQQAPVSPAVGLTFVVTSGSVSNQSGYVSATSTSTTMAFATGTSQKTSTVAVSFSN